MCFIALKVEQILRHVIGRIRRNWLAVEILVRGDSKRRIKTQTVLPSV
jgi:hypothetical protein